MKMHRTDDVIAPEQTSKTRRMQTTDSLLTDESINRPSKEEGKALGALVRQENTFRLNGSPAHLKCFNKIFVEAKKRFSETDFEIDVRYRSRSDLLTP